MGLLHSLSSPSTPQLNSPRDPRGTLFSIDAPAGRQDKGSPYSVTVSIVWTNDAQVRPNSYHTNQQLGPETTRSSQPIHTNHQPPPRELQSFCSLLTLSLHFPPCSVGNMPVQDSSSTYLEQMTALFSSAASYMRVPVLLSSVHRLPIFHSPSTTTRACRRICRRTYNGPRASRLS